VTAGSAYKREIMVSFILPLVYAAASGHVPHRLPSRPVHLRGDAEDVADTDLWRTRPRHEEPSELAQHAAPALRDAIRSGSHASRRKLVKVEHRFQCYMLKIAFGPTAYEPYGQSQFQILEAINPLQHEWSNEISTVPIHMLLNFQPSLRSR
jgi:hypothetical protein